MGVNASVVLYPEGEPPNDLDCESFCLSLFRVVQESGLVLPVSLEGTVEKNRYPGFWADRLPGVGFSLPAKYVSPSANLLVFTQTVEEFWDGRAPEGENPSELALPDITVEVLDHSRPLKNRYNDEIICQTWAMVGFDFGDCRLCDEIHTIRDERHPVFEKLESFFKSKVRWTIVPY